MKRFFSFIAILLLATLSHGGIAFAQSCSMLPNPSFEGTSGGGIVPSSCNLCTNTPDTEPWFSTIVPSDGSTCLGLFGEYGTYTESASQKFTTPLVSGQTYSFTVDICYATFYYYTCTGAGVKMYLGSTQCGKNQLIYSSGQITNTTWKTFTVSFTANSNYSYIQFETQNFSTANGYEDVLVDNIVFSPLTISTSSVNASCGNADGSASVTIISGKSPYTYFWSNGASTSSATNLISGSYTVSVTDANGCSQTASIIINDAGAATLKTSSTDESCGKADGSATVTATGGTAPYTYLWSNGASTSSATNLIAGTYTVKVTDANGCASNATVTINSVGAATLSSSTTDASCGQANGTATITATGGVAPFTYLWSNGQTSATASNLASGSYSVTVTDKNGCVSTTTVTVSDIGGATLYATTVDAVCGQANGSATVTASGGMYPYTYLWSNGQTTKKAKNLVAGTYSVTVTDANGCASTISVIVNDIGAATLATTTIDASCGQANGSATVSASGGVAPYTYLWSDGQTSTTASNLIAGNYSVTVTDSKGCVSTASITINDVTAAIQLTLSVIDASCGQANGSIAVTASSGTAPYTYLWSNGASTSSATNLTSGNYSVTVTDKNGCLIDTAIDINDNGIMTPVTTVIDESCSLKNGSAAVTVSGGTPPYTYVWNTGATTQNITNIASGIYSVTISDGKGCDTTISTTVNGTLSLISSDFNYLAQDYSIDLGMEVDFFETAVNAVQYYWDFGDGDSSLEDNPTHVFSAIGTYSVSLIATDQFGCIDTLTKTINVDADLIIYIPNTFTPNGDGVNDVFSVSGIGIKSIEYHIFNRWGNKIHFSSNLNDQWNGIPDGEINMAQTDTYNYSIYVLDILGTHHHYAGNINLIR